MGAKALTGQLLFSSLYKIMEEHISIKPVFNTSTLYQFKSQLQMFHICYLVSVKM